MERSEILKDLIKRLHDGASVDEVKADFHKHFKDVPAEEIVAAEQQLVQEGITVEEIQSLCDVHATLFEGNIQPSQGPAALGHPLQVFKEENRGLLEFLEGTFKPELEQYLKNPAQRKNSFEQALNELYKVDRHYARKENLFFPYLEKAGITAPPKVMWGVDDEIRAMLKNTKKAVAENQPQAAGQYAAQAVEMVEGMVSKENDILSPLLLKTINDDEWRLIARESPHIGYVFTGGREGASPSDAAAWLKKGAAEPETRGDAPIQLPSGFFNQNELTALLNTLPCDITFVGADDKVHYFSETRDRVFPRTRTIIGRDVKDCHPPKSLGSVLAIIDSFKAGIKDSESFWIRMGDKFILIRYYAVRDEAGKYLGVLEVTEDIAPLRALEGEKRL